MDGGCFLTFFFLISDCDLMTQPRNDVSFTEQEFPQRGRIFNHQTSQCFCVTPVAGSESRTAETPPHMTLGFSLLCLLIGGVNVGDRTWSPSSSHGSGFVIWIGGGVMDRRVSCRPRSVGLHQRIDVCSWSLTRGRGSCSTSR